MSNVKEQNLIEDLEVRANNGASVPMCYLIWRFENSEQKTVNFLKKLRKSKVLDFNIIKHGKKTSIELMPA